MFTAEERDRVRARLIELAEHDDSVVAAALTGSYVATAGDEWSDIDIALGVDGDLRAALARWTETFYDELGAIHHWDLPHLSSVYRVYLLPGYLEVDVAFTPQPTSARAGRSGAPCSARPSSSLPAPRRT